MELTEALESLIAQEGVSLFGIADTAGFQHALPDWHPRRLVPRAKRAVVFGRPFVGPKLAGVHKPCFRLLLHGRRPPDGRRHSCDREDTTRGFSALQRMQLVC